MLVSYADQRAYIKFEWALALLHYIIIYTYHIWRKVPWCHVEHTMHHCSLIYIADT
jgi:hypothetical protein